jgi:hypothetical protein
LQFFLCGWCLFKEQLKLVRVFISTGKKKKGGGGKKNTIGGFSGWQEFYALKYICKRFLFFLSHGSRIQSLNVNYKHQPQRKNCKDTFFSYLNQQIVIALLKILWFPQIDKTNSHWYKPFKAHEIWAARCTYCVCRREMIERRVQNTDNQK